MKIVYKRFEIQLQCLTKPKLIQEFVIRATWPRIYAIHHRIKVSFFNNHKVKTISNNFLLSLNKKT